MAKLPTMLSYISNSLESPPLSWRTALREPPCTSQCLVTIIKNGNENEIKKTTTPTDSRIITDYSTKGALPSLTLEIKRDPVHSGRYGRSCKKPPETPFKAFSCDDRQEHVPDQKVTEIDRKVHFWPDF